MNTRGLKKNTHGIKIITKAIKLSVIISLHNFDGLRILTVSRINEGHEQAKDLSFINQQLNSYNKRKFIHNNK